MRRAQGSDAGFSLLEAAVALGVVAVTLLSLGGLLGAALSQTLQTRTRQRATAAANLMMERVRALPYQEVGIRGSDPDGAIDPSDPAWNQVSIGGETFSLSWTISWQDDPVDGLASLGTDDNPKDYKRVELFVSWRVPSGGAPVRLVSYFHPYSAQATSHQPPTVVITSPPYDGIAVQGSSVAVEAYATSANTSGNRILYATATVSGGGLSSSVEIPVSWRETCTERSTGAACTASTPPEDASYSYVITGTWDTLGPPGFPDSKSPYTLTVAFADEAGARNTDMRVVYVDNTAPTSAPTLAGSAEANQAVLSWTEAEDATGIASYRIYRDGTQIAELSCAGALSCLSYTDTAVAQGRTYQYKVVGVDLGGHLSPESNTLSLTLPGSSCPAPDTTPPSWPSSRPLSGQFLPSSEVLLQWEAASDCSGISGYEVWRAEGKGGNLEFEKVAVLGGTAREYRDSGVKLKSWYSYYVRALDPSGNSAVSNTVEVRTQ